MKTVVLSPEEVLAGYDDVSQLYPPVPPMSMWRAWECAAYRRYALPEPMLDVGCGDGAFFRLLWPEARDVVGVEMDPGVADAARRSGVYREVHVTPAHLAPLPAYGLAGAFANCSLEHMDHLPRVLRRVQASLRPGAPFLLSVVTQHFLEWATLPKLVAAVGEPARAQALQAEYERYHHLVSPLPPEVWSRHLGAAGFDVEEHVPILPELTSRLFLLLDHLWHVRRPPGEVGDVLPSYLAGLPGFPAAFRQVLAAVMQVEPNWSAGSGAIFLARKRS
jgi:SAM-dependent methyltransferase